MAIYERAIAYTIGAGNLPHQAQAITDPTAVAALADVFDSIWEAASQHGARQQARPGPPPAADQAVLQLLAAGLIHAAIARRLDISVHAVRRRVNDIYAHLGAASPFQAGYKAAQRGWL